MKPTEFTTTYRCLGGNVPIRVRYFPATTEPAFYDLYRADGNCFATLWDTDDILVRIGTEVSRYPDLPEAFLAVTHQLNIDDIHAFIALVPDVSRTKETPMIHKPSFPASRADAIELYQMGLIESDELDQALDVFDEADRSTPQPEETREQTFARRAKEIAERFARRGLLLETAYKTYDTYSIDGSQDYELTVHVQSNSEPKGPQVGNCIGAPNGDHLVQWFSQSPTGQSVPERDLDLLAESVSDSFYPWLSDERHVINLVAKMNAAIMNTKGPSGEPLMIVLPKDYTAILEDPTYTVELDDECPIDLSGYAEDEEDSFDDLPF